MSDPRTNHVTSTPPMAASRRGQALVETALLLPVILILLLGAIDFGRLFFSSIALHQAARIAANAASVDPTTTVADVPALTADERGVMSCTPGAATMVYTRGGVPVAEPQLGDYAQVELTCDFSLVTPLATQLFGGPIEMRATSSFPVRTGCIGCTPGTGGGTPPPPPPEQCRTVPAMVGMSVGGARHAWVSAGFIGSFTTTAVDTETVAPGPVITPEDLACPSPLAIFNASVTVIAETAESEPAGCAVVPNLIGLSIAEARGAWAASGFSGDLRPPPPDADPDAAVTAQTTVQDGSPVESEPGVTCLDPASTPPIDLEVEIGDAWPAPPPAPCQVPHLIDKTRPVGESEWHDAGFDGGFSPENGNWVIKSQSLVGFSWVPCDSSITVSQQP